MSTEQVQEACEACGCYAEIGTVINEGDDAVLMPIEGDNEADARARLTQYEALAKEVCADVQVSSELAPQAAGVVLNTVFKFTCTAEKLIFELRARTL